MHVRGRPDRSTVLAHEQPSYGSRPRTSTHSDAASPRAAVVGLVGLPARPNLKIIPSPRRATQVQFWEKECPVTGTLLRKPQLYGKIGAKSRTGASPFNLCVFPREASSKGDTPYFVADVSPN